MPNVYRFPDVSYSAFENTIEDNLAVTISASGKAYGSQSRATRRLVSLSANGICAEGMGKIETLKRMLDGKLPLVRIELLPSHWLRANGRRGPLGRRDLELHQEHIAETVEGRHDGGTLVWTYGATITATAGGDSWPYVDCTGIAAGTLIAVGERVVIGGDAAFVTQVVESEAGFRLYLSKALPSGEATIGVRESIAARILEWPRVPQNSGAFTYNCTLVEALEADYVDGFTELSPW